MHSNYYAKKLQKYHAKYELLNGGIGKSYTYVYIDDKDKFVLAHNFQHKIVDFVYATGLNPVKSKDALGFTTPHHVYAMLYTVENIQNIYLINLGNKTVKIAIILDESDANLNYDQLRNKLNKSATNSIKLPSKNNMINEYNNIYKTLTDIIAKARADPSRAQITEI